MQSIQANYTKAKQKNEVLGAYPCLASVIKGRGFSRKSLTKAFNEMVPKEEYVKGEAKGLVDYLEYLTNKAEEVEFQAKNPHIEASDL